MDVVVFVLIVITILGLFTMTFGSVFTYHVSNEETGDKVSTIGIAAFSVGAIALFGIFLYHSFFNLSM